MLAQTEYVYHVLRAESKLQMEYLVWSEKYAQRDSIETNSQINVSTAHHTWKLCPTEETAFIPNVTQTWSQMKMQFVFTVELARE
jgi:hypothetical protein